jgi:hypothetical protein
MVAFSGMMFIPNFMKIHHMIPKLLRGYRHEWADRHDATIIQMRFVMTSSGLTFVLSHENQPDCLKVIRTQTVIVNFSVY